jgi:hypothetical protein
VVFWPCAFGAVIKCDRCFSNDHNFPRAERRAEVAALSNSALPAAAAVRRPAQQRSCSLLQLLLLAAGCWLLAWLLLLLLLFYRYWLVPVQYSCTVGNYSTSTLQRTGYTSILPVLWCIPVCTHVERISLTTGSVFFS